MESKSTELTWRQQGRQEENMFLRQRWMVQQCHSTVKILLSWLGIIHGYCFRKLYQRPASAVITQHVTCSTGEQSTFNHSYTTIKTYCSATCVALALYDRHLIPLFLTYRQKLKCVKVYGEKCEGMKALNIDTNVLYQFLEDICTSTRTQVNNDKPWYTIELRPTGMEISTSGWPSTSWMEELEQQRKGTLRSWRTGFQPMTHLQFGKVCKKWSIRVHECLDGPHTVCISD